MSQIIANHSHLKLLAVVDFAYEYEGSEDVDIDAHEEEFFLVDTKNSANPVYLWGHETGDFPKQIHKNFNDFLSILRDFKPKK